MIRSRKQSWCAAVLLATGCVMAAMPATAAPVNLVLSGSIFNVSDPSDVFGTAIGDTYSILLSYDPDLLAATPVGDASVYETAPGDTAITLSFSSSGGDAFSSDNSVPVSIGVRNTPDWLVTMMPGDGQDRFTLQAQLDAVTTLNLVLIESLGSNPLSSNDLPLGGFGGGPGTWSVSELDIDRTDLFANISGSVSSIESVAVPEPSASWLMLAALLCLAFYQAGTSLRRRWRGRLGAAAA